MSGVFFEKYNHLDEAMRKDFEVESSPVKINWFAKKESLNATQGPEFLVGIPPTTNPAMRLQISFLARTKHDQYIRRKGEKKRGRKKVTHYYLSLIQSPANEPRFSLMHFYPWGDHYNNLKLYGGLKLPREKNYYFEWKYFDKNCSDYTRYKWVVDEGLV